MRKTIKSTKPKIKAKRRILPEITSEDVENYLDVIIDRRVLELERKLQTSLMGLWNQREANISALTHRLDKTDHNVKAIFLRMKDLE